jgi:hypothetical protein
VEAPSQLLAVVFARMVARLSPRLRARAMRGWTGRIVIRMIFGGMRRAFDPSKAQGSDTVMHWEIGGADDAGTERWQVVLADGRCRPDPLHGGKLKIEGDLMLAAPDDLLQDPRPCPERLGPSAPESSMAGARRSAGGHPDADARSQGSTGPYREPNPRSPEAHRVLVIAP